MKMKNTVSGRKQWGKIILGIPLIVAVFIGATMVAGDAGAPIQVSVGESAVVAAENVAKLAVADPTIADVVPLTDKEISIIGKKTGATTLTIVHTEGAATVVRRIEVSNDP